MHESQDVGEKTKDATNSFPEHPDEYLQTIHTYRDGVRDLAITLMRNRRLEFKSSSPVYLEVNNLLSDIIINLEDLGEDPVDDRADIHAILKELNDAFDALDKAALLADQSQIEHHLEAIDKIKICRAHLNQAVVLMSFDRS